MRVHFQGAAGEVTGSLHLVEAAGKRVLLDCGLCQGSAEMEASNADPFPFDVAGIDALVVSHAHIDHIGRVPLLVKRGFRGPIYAQRATADLMPIMLLDSASLAEADAERFNRRRAHGEPEMQPLYTRDDVADATRRVGNDDANGLVRPVVVGQRQRPRKGEAGTEQCDGCIAA